MRKTSLNEVYKLACQDERVVFIGSDIGTGTLDEFKQKYPDRFFMEGVCEQTLIGMMTGLAMNGKIPYLNTIATFLTRRCFEQNVLDAGLHKQKVRLLGSGGGCVYAPLGPTHLATDDIAIMRTIPGMGVFAPCDAEEMKRLIPQTLDYPGPLYVRLAKGGDPVVSRAELGFEIGKPILLAEGHDVLLISTGVCTQNALQAREALNDQNISTAVLHVHSIKPFDVAAFLNIAKNFQNFVTIEEHVLTGGFGSMIAEVFADHHIAGLKNLTRLGFPDKFLEDYGSQELLMQRYGIDAASIAKTVQDQMG